MSFDTNIQFESECNDCRSYEREVKQLKAKITALESRNEELTKALNYLMEANPSDNRWNHPAAWENARRVLLNHGTKPNENGTQNSAALSGVQ